MQSEHTGAAGRKAMQPVPLEVWFKPCRVLAHVVILCGVMCVPANSGTDRAKIFVLSGIAGVH